MALTDQERERVRYHLGYPQTLADKSLQFGLVRSVETSFLVDSAMDAIKSVAEDRVRSILGTMDEIEERMKEAVGNLEAFRVDAITLRMDAHNAMEKEYRRWGYRLAEVLGCPVYQYSERYKGSVSSGVRNFPRR